MSDRIVGVFLMIFSVLVIILYAWLLFLPPDITVLGMDVSMFVVKATIMLGVMVVFGLIAWIGYTLATTPPPKPIEEIEKEIEREIKKLESGGGRREE